MSRIDEAFDSKFIGIEKYELSVLKKKNIRFRSIFRKLKLSNFQKWTPVTLISLQYIIENNKINENLLIPPNESKPHSFLIGTDGSKIYLNMRVLRGLTNTRGLHKTKYQKN